ncbi:MAG: flagellar hook-length control protein FliK [Candidatus Zixiibacteriota bacterium]
MNNGVMGPSASPIDNLLGFGAKQPAQGRSSPDGFGQLLGLFPQLQSSEMALPGMTDGLNPEMLGLKQFLIPDTMIQSPLESELKSGHFAHADLVMGEGDENQEISLRFKSMSDELSQRLGSEPGRTEKENMVLPMQIRTVEQNGKHLFADAILKTATGEDVSVRLKLDVTGNQNKTMGEGLIDVFNQGGAVNHVKQLPELIRDLNVKLVAIEGIEHNVQAFAKPTLSPAAKVFPEIDNSDIDPKGNCSKNGMVLNGMQSAKINSTFNAEASVFEKLTSQPTDNQIPINSEISSSFLNNQGSDDQKLTAATVKFFDLDFGLNKLKQNPGQKIRVQLSPARLGTMELSIASHRGHVTVNLVLESMQAKQSVERGLARLESQLLASGIKVDSFQLHVNGPNRGESFAGHQHHFYQGDFGRHQQGQRFYRDMSEKTRNLLNPSGESFDRIMVDCLA